MRRSTRVIAAGRGGRRGAGRSRRCECTRRARAMEHGVPREPPAGGPPMHGLFPRLPVRLQRARHVLRLRQLAALAGSSVSATVRRRWRTSESRCVPTGHRLDRGLPTLRRHRSYVRLPAGQLRVHTIDRREPGQRLGVRAGSGVSPRQAANRRDVRTVGALGLHLRAGRRPDRLRRVRSLAVLAASAVRSRLSARRRRLNGAA